MRLRAPFLHTPHLQRLVRSSPCRPAVVQFPFLHWSNKEAHNGPYVFQIFRTCFLILPVPPSRFRFMLCDWSISFPIAVLFSSTYIDNEQFHSSIQLADTQPLHSPFWRMQILNLEHLENERMGPQMSYVIDSRTAVQWAPQEAENEEKT